MAEMLLLPLGLAGSSLEGRWFPTMALSAFTQIMSLRVRAPLSTWCDPDVTVVLPDREIAA